MSRRLVQTILLAAAAVALTPFAHAQLSADYATCLAHAHSSTVQQGLCEQQELARQDARLNKAYQQVMSQYPADDAQRITLRNQERTWLKKRDYDCKVDHETVDDTCVLKKTAERADELEKQIKF